MNEIFTSIPNGDIITRGNDMIIKDPHIVTYIFSMLPEDIKSSITFNSPVNFSTYLQGRNGFIIDKVISQETLTSFINWTSTNFPTLSNIRNWIHSPPPVSTTRLPKRNKRSIRSGNKPAGVVGKKRRRVSKTPTRFIAHFKNARFFILECNGRHYLSVEFTNPKSATRIREYLLRQDCFSDIRQKGLNSESLLTRRGKLVTNCTPLFSYLFSKLQNSAIGNTLNMDSTIQTLRLRRLDNFSSLTTEQVNESKHWLQATQREITENPFRIPSRKRRRLTTSRRKTTTTNSTIVPFFIPPSFLSIQIPL